MQASAVYKPEAPAKDRAVLRWRLRLVCCTFAHRDIASPLGISLPCNDPYACGRTRYIVQFAANPVTPLGQVHRDAKRMEAGGQIEQQLFHRFQRSII